MMVRVPRPVPRQLCLCTRQWAWRLDDVGAECGVQGHMLLRRWRGEEVGAGVAGTAGSQASLSVCRAQGMLCVPGALGGRCISPCLFSMVSLDFETCPSSS